MAGSADQNKSFCIRGLLLKKIVSVIILLVLMAAYVVSVDNLGEIKILGGNITPMVNWFAFCILAAVGLIAAILVISNGTSSTEFLTQETVKIKRYHFYLILLIFILYKLFAFYITPTVTQYMWVWPDGAGFLSDTRRILDNPAILLNDPMKSKFYSAWLAVNHILFGNIVGSLGEYKAFGYTIIVDHIIAPIVLQNIIGILSALICFSIFSKINLKLAYVVTLLSFLNPTALAVDNTILRESLTLFFLLSAFAVFIKAVRRGSALLCVLSGVLFIVVYQFRPETILIYALLCGVLFLHNLFREQKIWKAVFLFFLPLILIIFFASNNLSYKYAVNINKGRFGIAMHGLKSKCYFYDSPTFPEFIKNMQKRLTHLEKERFAPCDAPCSTWQLVWFATDEEKARYNQWVSDEEPGKFVKIESDDQIFLDIARYNTFCYLQSVLMNVGYNLIHNVENISPILYDGNNYWISQNWVYYTTPRMLVLYENNKPRYKIIAAFFKAVELYTTRKILFPFLIIGSFLILRLGWRRFLKDNKGNSFLLLCTLVILWVHLLAVSVMAYPAARFIYVLIPFIFTVEIIGVFGVFYWLKSLFLKKLKD